MKAFEPSRRAPSAPGPMTARPSARKRSANPSTNGASGPITTRSASICSAGAAVTVIGSAMPGLPGVTTTSAVRASTWASACSRPPLPTTQTFMRRRPSRQGARHAVANETNCSRPGPTPTRRTGTPICSDKKLT